MFVLIKYRECGWERKDWEVEIKDIEDLRGIEVGERCNKCLL